jgi:ABC-type multidrug transport system fused ATPase/permease subunit
MTSASSEHASGAGALIWRFVTARRRALAGVVVLTVLSGAAEILLPWLMQLGVDTALAAPTGWTLDQIGLAMLATIIAIVAGHMASLWCETLLFTGAAFDLRRRLYILLERLPLATIGRFRTGSLAYRASNDVATLEALIIEISSEALFDAVVAAGAVIAMFSIDPALTGLVVAVMIVAATVSARFTAPLPVYRRASQMLGARLAGQLQESLSASRTVRAFGAEAQEIARLDATNIQIRGMDLRGGMLRAWVTPLWHFAEALGILAVIWYGGGLVGAGQLSIGTLVGFLAFQQLLAGPLNRMGGYVYALQSCRGLAGRLATLAALQPERPGPVPAAPDGGIHFDDVRFCHPDGGRLVLDGVSLHIAPGERVALLGANGAGKSTIFDLAMGLRHPDSGEVRVGGPAALAGLMPQETVLLRGTLAENLAVARPGATKAEMIDILGQIGGAGLLAGLPKGLETPVGERGLGLSGGERQLVGLARLMLRNPAILLLDEPAAQLDQAVLGTALAALARFSAGKTVLLVTHAPEMLALADRAILLRDGRVAATGWVDDMAGLACCQSEASA